MKSGRRCPGAHISRSPAAHRQRRGSNELLVTNASRAKCQRRGGACLPPEAINTTLRTICGYSAAKARATRFPKPRPITWTRPPLSPGHCGDVRCQVAQGRPWPQGGTAFAHPASFERKRLERPPAKKLDQLVEVTGRTSQGRQQQDLRSLAATEVPQVHVAAPEKTRRT
jgi:hypothetical protein